MFTYHPHLKNISKIIKKHIKHLYVDPEVRSVFTPLPFASFRSVRNLRNHLVDLNYNPRNGKQVVHVVLFAIILKNVTLSPVMSPKKRLK